MQTITQRPPILERVQQRNFFQMADTSRLRGHPLRKVRSRLDLRKFTFSQWVVTMWNDLSADVVTDSSVKTFKNKLDAHLKKHPQTVARVTATERTVHAYAVVYLLIFLYIPLKNRILNRAQGYVPLPFAHIYVNTHILKSLNAFQPGPKFL